MDRPVYLIIASLGVGGAEKRFAEIWQALATDMPQLRLVVPETTYQSLLKRPDMQRLRGLEDRIIRFQPSGPSLLPTLRALWPIVRSIPKGAVVHYPLRYFPVVHRLLRHRLVVSWVNSFLPPRAFRGSAFRLWALAYLSFREADRIDVLNPKNLEQLSRLRRLKLKLRLTGGGTFVDLAHFHPVAKRNKVAFLGRLEREKGALRFLEAALATLPRLAQRGLAAEFVLYGAVGDEADAVRGRLADHRDLPVAQAYADDPQSALADAKLFVSLQRTSNYPSKALAEAMACGCLPIVTDTGESRLMVEDDLATFLPADFTSEQLGDAMLELLSLPADEFDRRSSAVRALAERKFRIELQTEYFARLYRELGDEASRRPNVERPDEVGESASSATTSRRLGVEGLDPQ